MIAVPGRKREAARRLTASRVGAPASETSRLIANAAALQPAPNSSPRYAATTKPSRAPVIRPGTRAATPIAAAGPEQQRGEHADSDARQPRDRSGRAAVPAAGASTKRSTPASR